MYAGRQLDQSHAPAMGTGKAMETTTNSSSNSLGKLFSKSMASKRRRTKDKSARDSDASGPDGDHDVRSTSAFNHEIAQDSDYMTSHLSLADDDMDDGSFGSFESGTEQDAGRGLLDRDMDLDRDRDDGLDQSRSSKSPPPKKAPPAKPFLGFEIQIPEPSAAAKSAPRTAPADRRSWSSAPKLHTVSPITPPKDQKPAPLIVNTPPTPTDHGDRAQPEPSPTGKPAANGSRPEPAAGGSQGVGSTMNIVHRRSKSGSAAVGPSKLSHAATVPLTPVLPSAGEATASASGGFFSSMFSAAANSISGNNSTAAKSRTSLNKLQSSPAASQPALDDELDAEPPRVDDTMDRKESAVRTLGSGDLSLSHLGLAEPSESAVPAPDITRSRSESAPTDPLALKDDETLPTEASSRPRSLVDTASDDQTPFLMDYSDAKPPPIERASSLRSVMKPHRKRGSSVTTSATIATAVVSAHSTALHPVGHPGAPKLTGFAIASKKRNRDFHTLFKSVPDDDYLIEDYSCALQREILAHGRLYVSEGHLCFSSNILGWTTTLVMSFDEIVSVEKRSTALLFKNGLMISTLHAKHVFASFTSRDATYDLIVNIWKLGHPTLRSTLNGVQLEGTGGDKTEKVNSDQEGDEAQAQDGSGSEQSSDDDEGGGGGDDDDDDDDDEEFYDEEEHEELLEKCSAEITAVEHDADKSVVRKASTMPNINGAAAAAAAAAADLLSAKDSTSTAAGSVDFPGPATHAPTDCGDSETHYDRIVADEVIAAPVGKVYNLMFGPESVIWMNRWLSSDQKCTDIQMEDKKGLTGENKSRTFSYIKPLNGSIGPKQTKCIVTESIDSIDLEKAVNIGVSTQTPEVPYGNLFTTKTKYCLTWAENNATRMQINCTVEWSGKCWLKGTIEKNVNEGQGQYAKELFASLRSAVSSRTRSSTGPGANAKGKKKLKKNKASQSTHDVDHKKSNKSDARKQGWGPLEPLRGSLEPLVDVLQPVLTRNVTCGLLVCLVVTMWFWRRAAPKPGPLSSPYGAEPAGYGYHNSRSRQAAYEEMWRRQDSELWEWLEERVGMDRLGRDQPNGREKGGVEPRTVEDRLREERMNEREMQEAIRVTEEKLRVLKEVVERGGSRAAG